MNNIAIVVGATLLVPMAHVQGSTNTIEEVLVTARKVQESLQDVPVAITAVTSSQIDSRSINRLNEIAAFAPNVNAAAMIASAASSQIAIRGMTSMDLERSFEPAVGVAVDGVYTSTNATQDLDMFDIDSVEILRGPQGTLHGRNSIGGAMLINRKQASIEDDVSGKVKFGYGNYNAVTAKAAINVPVNDSFALRFSTQYRDRDGFAENQYPGGEDLEGIDKAMYRIGAFWQIDDSKTLTLNYDHVRDRSSVGANRNVTRAEGYWTGTGYAPFTWCAVGNACTSEEMHGDDLWHIESDFDNLYKIDSDSVTAEYVWDINDNHQLTVLAGYSELDELIGFDWDGSADANTVYIYGNNQAVTGPIVQGVFYHTPYRDQTEETGSLEVRLSGSLSEDVSYVAGVYYFNTEYQLNATNLAFGDVVTGLQDTNQETTSIAAFGELKWAINDKWRANAGVRYTRDDKDFKHELADDFDASFSYSCAQGYYVGDQATCDAANAGLLGTAPYAQADTSASWSEVTPRVGLDYQVNDATMVYLSVSTGYKAGGFNGRGGTDQIANVPYDPETVNSLELGFKSQFWDDRARLNIAVFRADYENMQTEVNVPTTGGTGQTPIVMNVGKSRSQGVEVELLVMPLPDTRINLSYGYLDAVYTDLKANLFGEKDINGGIIIYDYSGNSVRRAPKNSVSVSLNQGFDMSFGRVNWVLDYNWTDTMHMTIDNDPYHEQDAIGLFGSSLTLTSNDDHWNASIWGKNLTDQDGLGYGLRIADIFEIASPIAEPRTYGVTVGYNF